MSETLKTVLYVVAAVLGVLLVIDFLMRRRSPRGEGGGDLPILDIGHAFRELKTGIKDPQDRRVDPHGDVDDDV